MREQIVDLKKQYPLHIRIGFLTTLVLLILSFIFVPEMKNEPYLPKFSKPIKVDKLPPQLQNIVKPPPPPKPKLPKKWKRRLSKRPTLADSKKKQM